jgi:hypothetical protein
VALDRRGITVHAGDDAARAVWFDVTARSEGAREELTLSHGDEVLRVSFGTSRLPISGLPRATDVEGDGLAFDHANIVADAWLMVQGR